MEFFSYLASFFILMMTIWSINSNRSLVFANLDNTFFAMTMKSYRSPANCYRPVKRCIPLNVSLPCLDVSLPYKFTAYSLPFEQSSSLSSVLMNHQQMIEMTRSYLDGWKGLRSIPQCWKALQTALCASFFPRCDNDSSRVILPTYEMCRLTRAPCRIIDEHFRWPSFLQCENETFFPTKCPNSYTDLKFSTTIVNSRCPTPLVSTDDSRIFYHGFDGCSLHCINPVYSNEQYEEMSKIIAYGSVLGSTATLFAICSFLIDRACLKRRFYTSVIFYLNLCMLLATTGWMLQLLKGRNDIVCRSDNTIRYGEPSKSDHFYCCLSFLLIYYFSLAASIWFVHLFRVFYKTFYGLSTGMKMDFNKFHFHMFSWSIPLIMTILIFLLGEIDADPLRGICFVGTVKPVYRIIFVLVPQTICIFTGLYHACRTVLILFKAKQKCENQNSRRSDNIHWALIRITFFSTAILVIYLVTSGAYFYELYIKDKNLRQFNDHLVCELNISTVLPAKYLFNNESLQNKYNHQSNSLSNEPYDIYGNGYVSSCRQYEPPNLWFVCLQLIAIFCSPILTSSWIWTRATISTWRRFLNRQLCNSSKETKESLRLKPYELIANSYQKREQIQQGLYVPSLVSNHNDPVDMEINSAQSQSVSTNFQQNFAALLNRRYAIWGGNNNNENMMFVKQHYGHKNVGQSANYQPTNTIRPSSFLSQNLSISDASQQQASFESMEQQQMTEMTTYHRNQRRKKKKEREKRLFTRRDSDTSGSIISAAFTAAKAANRLRETTERLTSNQANQSSTNANTNSFVTKSTSTGDLFNILFGSTFANAPPQPTAAMLNGYNPYAMAMMQTAAVAAAGAIPPPQIPPHSFITPGSTTAAASASTTMTQIASHTSPNHAQTILMNGSNCPPTSMASNHNEQLITGTSGCVRMQKDQCVSTFAFTHGMSDQTSHTIINPMIEKRRPDSSIRTTQQPKTNNNNEVAFSNLVIVNQAAAAASTIIPFANANYMMNTMSTNHAAVTPATIYPVPNVATAAYHQHQMYTNGQAAALVAAAAAAYGGYPPPTQPLPANMIAAASLPRYYNTQAAFLAYQQSKSLAEIENLMREHEKFKSLITAHQSDTESNSEFFPIHLTESESSRNGYYSDDHRQLQSSRLLVQELNIITI
ncbi:smoothened-like protein [Dermatophagoides farinae]|uniref:Smoothened-like protein n=1 Tax=Dermatophagoides farinae TaxID=6954 RepID=A0A9D4SK83_DERFA|nr:smoothened-like protein [Dermatophagoides farinae]